MSKDLRFKQTNVEEERFSDKWKENHITVKETVSFFLNNNLYS